MSYISGTSWCWRKSWIKYYTIFHFQMWISCLDITILLAMVVFMDQLTQQTPPVAEKLPVIGQVNIAYCQASRSRLEYLLDNKFSVTYHYLSSLWHHSWLFPFQWWLQYIACDFIMWSAKDEFRNYFEKLSKCCLNSFAFIHPRRYVNDFVMDWNSQRLTGFHLSPQILMQGTKTFTHWIIWAESK